jgi:hypothetical protein
MSDQLFATIIGGAIAGGVAIVVMLVSANIQAKRDDLTRQQQRESEAQTYRRSVQDAKRNRLLDAYRRMYLAGAVWEAAVIQHGFLVEADETTENRDKRIAEMVRSETAGINEARASVALDGISSVVETHFQELRRAHDGYWIAAGARQDAMKLGGSHGEMQTIWNDMKTYKASVTKALEEMLAAMKADIQKLEQA